MSNEWEEFIKTVSPLKKRNGRIVAQPLLLSSPPKDFVHLIEERSKKPHLTIRHYRSHDICGIEGKLDLHGLTLETVEGVVRKFLEKKYRWVLIVTGKGQVIRKWFLKWIEDHPEYIIGFTQALPKDGGSGAFYLHIRQERR